MDATDRIVNEFDRLVEMGRQGVATRSIAERIVYYIVATRCEIDIDGFDSVYEQDLNPTEIAILVEGLNQIDECDLATEFRRGYELLNTEGFYLHMNWNKVSASTKAVIDAIGKRIGDRLWNLDQNWSPCWTHPKHSKNNR